jgi:alpha-glucosidase
MLTDGINANHNAEDYLLDTQLHHSGETLTLKLASGGGFVIRFGKMTIADHL